ncbi:MAG: tRNA dihydrouridine synthase DusB, partial [Desulfobacteraceae bacterium]|nr:tRNA dihydrouridine synthase DusB [Desulfobacteraceae bacterium]
RKMIKQRGCGLVCSEMISANGLCHGSEKTIQMMGHAHSEKPFSLQISGAKPKNMATAALMAKQAGADIIDINCGCAVKKVVKTGAGAALMKEIKAAEKIFKAVRQAVDIPVTVKMRSGWDPSGEDALAIAKVAQECGIDAVTIHPRTVRQKFSGKAKWSIIAEVKQALSIPVIGNGDIRTPEDALEMMRQTGCDAVMIGKAALGDPWIFSGIRAGLAGACIEAPDLAMRFSAIKGYVSDMIACYGETHACRIMRSRLGWLLKGLPEASRWREAITGIATAADAYTILEDYLFRLQAENKSEIRNTNIKTNSNYQNPNPEITGDGKTPAIQGS